MLHALRALVFAGASLVLTISESVRTQCTNPWAALGGVAAGVHGEVFAMREWDPDDKGPLPPRLIVGGHFLSARSIWSPSVVQWNPTTGGWSHMGTGLTNPGNWAAVSALAVLPDNSLIAGGDFVSAGSVATSRIARWDGLAWSPLGAGLNATVRALGVLPDGQLLAGGNFTQAGSVPVTGLARWNGTNWAGFGAGLAGDIEHLVVFDNGDVIVAGRLRLSGSSQSDLIARWNGSNWSRIATPGQFNDILSMVALPNGDLVVADENPFGQRISRWNGSTWEIWALLPVRALGVLFVDRAGELNMAGDLTTLAGAAGGIARRFGAVWQAVAPLLEPDLRAAVQLSNGRYVVGGSFRRLGAGAMDGTAQWNGTAWSALGAGGVGAAHGTVTGLVALSDGRYVCAGSFDAVGGVPANGIAMWNGAAFVAFGSGVSSPGRIDVLLATPDGGFLAGGTFSAIAGVPVNNLARWDGTTWHSFGNGVDAGCGALALLPDGRLLAAGWTRGELRAWDGTSWSQFGDVFDGHIAKLLVTRHGALIAAGTFTTVGGTAVQKIARWDGMQWQPLGAGFIGEILDVCELANGDLIASGSAFLSGSTLVNHVARWDGVAWQAMGSGLMGHGFCLQPLPNGDVLVGGTSYTAGGVWAPMLARWNGATWSAFGAGVMGVERNPWVAALAQLTDGSVIVGGDFPLVATGLSHNLARLTTSCPATIQSLGTPCIGGSGPMQLTVTERPWLGGGLSSRCNGFVAGSLGFALLGFQSPGTPLAGLHPAGVPGCTLLAAPDALQVLVPSGSEVTCRFPIPASLAFVSVPIHHQVLQLELAGGGVALLVGSNGVRAVTGTF